MKLYLAGPMSGHADLNYPAFNAVAKRLRELGHEVSNPAENPEPECGSWAGYMRLAIGQLVQCECIVLLPGWSDSRGAVLERMIAQALGIAVARFNDPHIETMHPA